MTASFISRDLEQQRGALVQRGIAVLIIVALLVGGFMAYQNGLFSSQVTVKAEVDDIGGALVTGNDVKVRGVIIGKVASIAASDDGVRLTLDIDPEEADRLPGGVTARILPATVFGTSFVDLVPPAEPSGTFTASTVIQQDPSSETRELQDALDASYEILTAVEPSRLSATLGAFAEALDGRGDSLGVSLETLDAYLTRLEPHLPQVQEDLRLLATNFTTIAEVAPEMLDAVENAFVTTQTIVDRQADLASVLTGGDALVDEAHVLVADTQQSFLTAIEQSAPIVETMFDQRLGFARTFDAMVDLSSSAASALRDPDTGGSAGGYLDTAVDIVLNLDSTYTAQDCAVFGPPEYRAFAPNCGTTTTSSTVAAPDDSGLVAEIQGLLAQLEAIAAGDPHGIGDVLTRGFVTGGETP